MDFLRREHDGIVYPYSRKLEARADFARCTPDGLTYESYKANPIMPDEDKAKPPGVEFIEKIDGLSAADQRRLMTAIEDIAATTTEATPSVAETLPVTQPSDTTPGKAEPATPEGVSTEDALRLAALPTSKDELIALGQDTYGIPLDRRLSVRNMQLQLVEAEKAGHAN